MKDISDFRGEEAIELCGDIIDPAIEIFGDEEVKEAWDSGNKLKAAKIICKKHPKDVITILAIMEGETYEEYKDKVTPLTAPVKIVSLLNNKELASFLSYQDQKGSKKPSGSVTGNTEEKED